MKGQSILDTKIKLKRKPRSHPVVVSFLISKPVKHSHLIPIPLSLNLSQAITLNSLINNPEHQHNRYSQCSKPSQVQAVMLFLRLVTTPTKTINQYHKHQKMLSKHFSVTKDSHPLNKTKYRLHYPIR